MHMDTYACSRYHEFMPNKEQQSDRSQPVPVTAQFEGKAIAKSASSTTIQVRLVPDVDTLKRANRALIQGESSSGRWSKKRRLFAWQISSPTVNDLRKAMAVAVKKTFRRE